MSTTYGYRALQAILQDFQGAFGVGPATVRASASGAPVTLEHGAFAIPIVDEGAREELTVKVDPNPATADGSWSVTRAGASVTFSTLQGGQRCNLPAGTRLKFDPPVTGLESMAVVGTGGIVGGAPATTNPSLLQVRCYKDLGARTTAADFFRAQLGEYPAVAICWASTDPGDGTSTASLGVSTARAGNGRRLFVHEFSLYLVGTRLDGSNERRRELDYLRDCLLELLTDRVSWRDLVLNCKVLDARATGMTPDSYIDTIRVTIDYALQRSERRTFNPWRKTRLRASKTALTDVGPNEVDNTDDMPTT
jgi:hypothetical protein